MRCAKNEKNKIKIKNNFNDFYLSWIDDPNLTKKFNELSKIQIKNVTSTIKREIDYMYEAYKIEEKYIYYINLYKMYETLYRYFNVRTFLYKKTQKKYSVKEMEKYAEEDFKNSPEQLFGYEVAFSKKLSIKINDSLHWLSVFIEKFYLLYVMPLKKSDTSSKLCKEFITRMRALPDNFSFCHSKELKKKAELINEVFGHIEYARNNIDVIYSGQLNTDKKVIKIGKSTLTKIEKIMNCLKFDLLDETIKN